MDSPMGIAILKAILDEVRGIRDDLRESREESKRYKLKEEEKERAAKKEGKILAFKKVEKFTPYPKSFAYAGGQRIGRKEGENMLVKEKTEDWQAERGNTEQEPQRKGVIEKIYRGPDGRLELQRRLRGVMARTPGAQMASRRPGATEAARSVVRPEVAEITLHEVLEKKREISQKQKCGMVEDLTLTERATWFRLRQKAEEEWRKENEAQPSREDAGIDVEEW